MENYLEGQESRIKKFSNLPNCFVSDELLVSQKNRFKKIFFYRVCGTGMGNAAILLQKEGFHVEGGDTQFYPPMSDMLEKSELKLCLLSDLTDEYLKSFDLIVVGNVVSKGSDEALRLESLGVYLASFPQVLGAFVLSDRNVVGIAGTHGKTSTTYLLAQMFEKLGQNPGYLIGGVLEEASSSFLGSDSYFFIESDEYDSSYFHKFSKFHYYQLNHLILTSLEFDHADIFSSIDEIEREFFRLTPNISGNIIANSSYSSILKVFEKNQSQAHQWSFFKENGETGPFNISFDKSLATFSLLIGKEEEVFQTNLKGIHNILNLSACIIFAYKEGFKIKKIKEVILDLKKVKRRQEVKGYYLNSLVIDDFAHHPTAVKLTLQGLREEFSNKKIIGVFAPTSATARSSIFQDEFSEALSLCDDLIIVSPKKKKTVKHAKNINCQQIKNDFSQKNYGTVDIVNNLHDLRRSLDCVIIKNNLDQKESLVIIMSNGDTLGLWESDFANQVKSV